MSTGKKLISNFSYLTAIQLVTLAVPFIYYPYIIRKYDLESYGLVVFIQSIIMLMSILVDFGFNIYGTRAASEERDNKNNLSIIYSSITYIKLGLVVFCFILYQVFIFFNDKLSSHFVLSISLYLIVLGEALFSQWLYLGIEKIKFAAAINLITRLLLLLLIIIGSNTSLGFYAFPVALIISSLLNGLFSTIFIRNKIKLKFTSVSFQRIKFDILESYSFLLSRSVGVIILKLNTYLIGNYIGLTQVAFYDLAEKLINLLLIPLNLLNQVLYPHIAKTKKFSLTFNVIKYLFILYLIGYPIIYFYGKDIITIFAGSEMIPAYKYFIILYFIPLSNVFTYFLGNCFLVLINKKKDFNNSIYFAAAFYLIFIIINEMSVDMLCWSLVLNAVITCVCRIISSLINVKKLKHHEYN